MLANRVEKTFRHLHRRFDKLSIGAFRLYDRDIPEIRATVDWYEGHLVLSEYVRRQTEDLPDWLERMAEAVAARIEVPKSRVYLKRRRTRPTGGPGGGGGEDRYQRLAQTGHRVVVREGELRFLVNLADYLDTGLFLDHRITRGRVREASAGKRVLNLYAYTGSFTVYAAAGGATAITTVDASPRYLEWAADNLRLNRLERKGQRFVAEDTFVFLEQAQARKEQWDLVVCDPPSYSTPGASKAAAPFDVMVDHPALLTAVAGVLAPGGSVWFSTNHQAFLPRLEGLPYQGVEELTRSTLPEDFRGREPHRVWRLTG